MNMFKKLIPIILILTCCKSLTDPKEDYEYYKWVCMLYNDLQDQNIDEVKFEQELAKLRQRYNR